MKRQALALILLPLLAATLGACSPGQSARTVAPEPTVGTIATPTAQRPLDAGKTLLRVGTGDLGDGLAPHHEIIARFEAANPDIQIQLEPVGSGDYYQLIFDQIATGNPPDILQIGDDAVPSFVDRKALVSLDDYIVGAEYPLDTKIYLPGVLEPGRWAGSQYLLPKDFTPLAVYYNKKLFDQYGVPYPQPGWSWDDFLRTAQALTKDTDGDGTTDLWGVQLTGNWTTGFEYWVAAAGGQLVSADGAGFLGYMDSPQSVEALQFYHDLYHTYKVAPIPANLSPFAEGNDQFERGLAAMRVFGRWPQANLRKNPAIELGVAGMPGKVRQANILLWGGFGISSLSQHREAAWRFLRFYVGKEGAEVWKDWGLPTVRSVAEAAGLDKDPIEGVWLGELEHLVPRAYTSVPTWGQSGAPALTKLLEKVITQPEADITAALYDAAIEAQGSLVQQQ
ncbi:MAG: sugar ABC transporter substrate-binding protein [Chloroflexales bacterium]|nr:sugar ABC transporter substrate-binding protein [Chloroflexales bacterium]